MEDEETQDLRDASVCQDSAVKSAAIHEVAVSFADGTRGEPQIRSSTPLKVLADEQCMYHCLAASYNVEYYESLSDAQKLDASYYVKGVFLDFLLVAEFIGGSLYLSADGEEELGSIHYGPLGVMPLLHIRSMPSADGAGHKSPHFKLQQSWIRAMKEPPYVDAENKLPLIKNLAMLRTRMVIPGAASKDDEFMAMRNKTLAGFKKLQKHKKLP